MLRFTNPRKSSENGRESLSTFCEPSTTWARQDRLLPESRGILAWIPNACLHRGWVGILDVDETRSVSELGVDQAFASKRQNPQPRRNLNQLFAIRIANRTSFGKC